MTPLLPPDLSAFGDLQPVAPLAGGERNLAWLVQRGADRLVAKSTRRSEEALHWLLPLQAAARAGGFVVPRMIRAADGRFAPNGWTLERFVAGQPALAGQMHALAPKIRAFHMETRGLEQRPGFASSRDLIVQTQGGDVDLTKMPADLAERCRAAWSVPTGSETGLHGDLGPGNVILTADGPALIDWDEARRDLALYDMGSAMPMSIPQTRAVTAWEIACCWQTEPERAQNLAKLF